MKKREFLDKLRRETHDEAAVNYYDELISDRVEAGETEESVIASYDIKKIARSAEWETMPVPTKGGWVEPVKNGGHIGETFPTVRDNPTQSRERDRGPRGWVVLLALFAAPVTIPLGFAFFMVLFAFTICGIAFVAGGVFGIAWLVGMVIELVKLGEPIQHILLNVGGGLVALGLLGIVGYYLSKVLWRFYKWCVRGFAKKGEQKRSAI